MSLTNIFHVYSTLFYVLLYIVNYSTVWSQVCQLNICICICTTIIAK